MILIGRFLHLSARPLLILAVTVSGLEFIENSADAQEKTSAALQGSTGTLRSSWLEGYEAPRFGDFRINATIKSTNTAGRFEELGTQNDRRYRIKSEYVAGFLHSSGWGLSGTAVTTGVGSGDERKSTIGAGDPSMILTHPQFFDDGNLRITGAARRYFNVTPRSRDRGMEQYAYYLTTTYRLGRGWNVFNQVVPRYFFQSYYRPEDTTALFESFTTISRQTFSWLRFGCGSHSALEQHRETSTGTYVEIYPYASFTLSRNILIEPRLYLPVQKTNTVNESARAVSLNNAQAELYAQLTL